MIAGCGATPMPASLGHRRLSIIDLSPGGYQPMSSGDGRYLTTYDGEVYNYTEVAARLRQQGAALRTRSDTEVLIEGFARWASPKLWRCAKACSLWRCGIGSGVALTLARDRLGIKPLYWSRQDRLFRFASELKALRRHPDWHAAINRDATAAFLRIGLCQDHTRSIEARTSS